MPAPKKKRKIVKYRRGLRINTGIVIFGGIFVYMIITIFLYLTSSHVTAYEVREGSLVKDHTYTGLILRQEKIVSADRAGYVSYYAREGEKVGVKTPVYTIDESGESGREVTDESLKDARLDGDDLSRLQLIMENFSGHFNAASYSDTYNFKYDMESRLLELATENLTKNEKKAAGLDVKYAAWDGVIAYSVDGMESLKPEDVKKSQLNAAKYEKDSLRSDAGRLVSAGEPVYKLITSEKWNIVLRLGADTADKLKGEKTVTVRFLKDDSTLTAGLKLMKKDNQTYAVLSMSNSMVRFATERYTELELVLDNVSGLKLPKTAIVEKDFYVVPKEYLTKGGNKNEKGFLRETAGENGTSATQFVTASVYEETDTEVYVDKAEFQKADALIKPDSTDRYILGETKALKGVYNVNKGYAVFKKIDMIAENDEYAIVKEGTDYGLSQYDYIALDGKTVTEEDFIR